MSKLAKKFASIVTAITVVAMIVGPVAPVQADTASDLQAQVAALQAQLATLVAQLATATGETTVPVVTGSYSDCAGVSFDRNLKLGMSGADVKCMQQILNGDVTTQVAATGVGSSGSETMYFGGLTKAAVIKFQEKYASEVLAVYGLTSGTGFVGATTKAKLTALVGTGGTTGTGTTLPAGCTSSSGFSPTTGQSCATGAVTPPVVVLPAGCTSASGFSPTTGQSCSGGTADTSTGTVFTGVVTASLASDNPVTATIVSDTAGSQANIPVLKVNLSNGTASPISVTSLKFTRSGISEDTNISQAYLYDGDVKLADYNSFRESVLTFNSSGLFTIPANSVKTITLKVDLANGIASSKQIRFSIDAATDIVSNASSIGGVFPIISNIMSTALVTTLGKLTVTAQNSETSAPDPGTGVEVFKFTLAAANQNMEVQKIVFSNVGTVAYTDLANFQLFDAATPVGDVVASANTDKTVTMIFATPIAIAKGTSKNMTLKADIVAGTSRDYTFSFQNMADIVAYDTQYKVFVKPNQSDSWSLTSPDVVGVKATISNGKVTASRATDSPSSNISASSTNQVLAKFTIKASGEDVKITDLRLQINGSIGTVGMYQTSIYYDGAQIGQTTTTMNTQTSYPSLTDGGTVFSFGNTLVLPAGVEKILEVRSDIKNKDGGSIAAGSTITAKIAAFTATGKTSSATVVIGSVTGYQLTVSAGIITAAMNQAVPDWTALAPTGVAGANEVLVGSYIVTAGSGEGAKITGISMQFSSTSMIQKVKLYKGTKDSGVQLGSTWETITASTTNTFYPSPYVSLEKSEQFTLNVYADILTGIASDNYFQFALGTIYGTGQLTNASVNSVNDATTFIGGQKIYVSSGGYLGVETDTNTPDVGLAIMNTIGVEFAEFKFSASSSPESMSVSSIIATTTLTSAQVGALRNITLTSSKNPSWKVTLTGLDANGVADFTGLMAANPLVIAKGLANEDVVILKADIAPYNSVVIPSGSDITFGLRNVTYRGESGNPTTMSPKVAGYAQYVYMSKPTVALVTQPSDRTLTNGTKTLLSFTVSADAKGAVDLYQVNLGAVISEVTGSAMAIGTIGLYRVGGSATALNSSVGTSTAAAAYTSTTIALGIFGYPQAAVTGDILLKNTGDAKLIQIPAGTSYTFEVRAEISGVAELGDNITAKLRDLVTGTENAIVWNDTVASSNISSLYVDSLPTASWSLTR